MEIHADQMNACETEASPSTRLSPQSKPWQKFSIAACLKISGFLVSLILLSIANTAIAQTVLRRGDSGTQVSELQRRLTQVGCYTGPVNGSFGPLTEDGVKQCQQKYGLQADGIVGSETYAVLFQTETPPTNSTPTSPYNPPSYGQVLKKGDAGDAVLRAQQQLRSLGFYQGQPDGIFGDETEQAVLAFQRNRGLPEDGVIGYQVYQAFNGSPSTTIPPVNRPTPVSSIGYGDRGERVRELQRRLTASGYPVVVDGIYGEETARAVRLFQQQRGLPVSSTADARTFQELGIVGSSVQTTRYAVIVPNPDATTLPQVKQVFPQAQLKTDRRGDYVLAGIYATPEEANQSNDILRSRGLDARVIFQ